MQGAAGAAGDKTYIDDVFSTYLYKGNGGSQPIDNGLKLGNANTGNSVLFDDTDDYLQIAHTTDLCFGNGDFTIECWAYYRGDFDSFDALFGNWGSAGSYGYVLETVGSGATTDLEFYYYNDSNTFVGPIQGGTLSKDQWNHLCVCRSGNTIRLFVNGTMYGSGTSMNEGIRDGTTPFTIGGQVAGSGWWNGYISNLRVTKGQGLYTSNFTPSTQALTTTSQGATASNVKLLCCNKDTLTGATVTPSPIISDANYNGVPSNPIHSVFGPFTGTDGEGGMVWTKSRSSGSHIVTDTVRGAGKGLVPNSNDASSNNLLELSSFNNSGFSIGNNYLINANNENYASWTWRINKGFFDVVQYTGNGSAGHQVAHSLGCEVGFMMVKRLENAANWSCYHRDAQTSGAYLLTLNSSGAAGAVTDIWNNTAPTSTHFTLGTSANTNGNGETYICYLFAGGESTDATARSVVYNGSSQYLRIADNDDFDLGTGDYTIECWARLASNFGGGGNLFCLGNENSANSVGINIGGSRQTYVYADTGMRLQYADQTIMEGQWYHFALVRNSGTLIYYVNGINGAGAGNTPSTYSQTSSPGSGSQGYLNVGAGDNGSPRSYFPGEISNFRIVKGTAVYTSAFKPPTEPLTNITNTKLLCCNNSSTAGSTVTPGTITAHNSPTASTDSPFDDPEGFKFGEEGDQNIIKTGSYIGNGSATGPKVNLGFEPQWILIKNAEKSENWLIWDSMRGIVTGGYDARLFPNLTTAESNIENFLNLTSTGFQINDNGGDLNEPNDQIIYMAVRRPDGYVSKPAEVGSDVFTQAYGVNSGDFRFTSGFPVDFAWAKLYAGSGNWWTSARLIQGREVKTNNSDAEQAGTNKQFDSNVAWHAPNADNTYISHMWKRGAGFDVVTIPYTQSSSSTLIHSYQHNLNVIPEMIWFKSRDTGSWYCYHKGQNGGSSPWDYALVLNANSAEANADSIFGIEAPTSTHFGIKASQFSTGDYIAMLFASVEGISKCGYYDGNGSTQTITTGFSPRFLIIKRSNISGEWYTLDTTRGWGSGNDKYLALNDSYAQQDFEFGAPTSTGFTLASGNSGFNESGSEYIYYAHA